MSKRIIDVCCGSKMFWFDKDNEDVEFCDNRVVPLTEYYPKRFIEVSPDTVSCLHLDRIFSCKIKRSNLTHKAPRLCF